MCRVRGSPLKLSTIRPTRDRIFASRSNSPSMAFDYMAKSPWEFPWAFLVRLGVSARQDRDYSDSPKGSHSGSLRSGIGNLHDLVIDACVAVVHCKGVLI